MTRLFSIVSLIALAVILYPVYSIVTDAASTITNTLDPSDPLYSFVVTVDHNEHVADYDLTLSDCVGLMNDRPYSACELQH